MKILLTVLIFCPVLCFGMIIENCTSNYWIASDGSGSQQVAVAPNAVLNWNYQGNWGGILGTNITDYEPIAAVHGDNPRVLQTNFNNNSVITITTSSAGHYQYCWAVSPYQTNGVSGNITVTNLNNVSTVVSNFVTVTVTNELGAVYETNIWETSTNESDAELISDSGIQTAFNDGIYLSATIVAILIGFSFLRTISGDNHEDI